MVHSCADARRHKKPFLADYVALDPGFRRGDGKGLGDFLP